MAEFVNQHVDVRPTNIKVVALTTPSAGADIVQVVPLGRVWRLLTFVATFTASATVASRTPSLIIDDGTNVLYQVYTATAVTAGQAMQVRGNAIPIVLISVTAVATNSFPLMDPSYFVLQPGWRIRTATSNIDATDQWSAARIVVDELPYPYPTA